MPITMITGALMPDEPVPARNDLPILLPTRPLATSDWRQRLPVLQGAGFHLRELRRSDAASLFSMLTTEEVARFIITSPPTSVEGFERFIDYTHRQRTQGMLACFAVVPQGLETAIGIFQVRSLDGQFSTAEWGFALGSPFWGTGLFVQAAALVTAFAFKDVGVNRLEARSMVANGRANAALRKVGARHEAVLRQSRAKDGCLHDEHLWAILETEWRQVNGVWQPAGEGLIRKPRLSESVGITGEPVH